MITGDFFKNKQANATPLILFILTIVVCGGLYTLFFIEIGIPSLSGFIPASDTKTFIMMGIYAIPLITLVIGVLCLIKAGQKRTLGGYQ